MNKRERVMTALHGKTPDQVPVGFWHHYSAREVGELVDNHIDFYNFTDIDLMKIMYEFMYSFKEKVEIPSDWYHIKPLGKKSPQFQKQIDVINGILDRLDDDVMVVTTMFNAIKMATWCTSDALVMAHAKEDPVALLSGINALCDVLLEWVDTLMDTGIDGIYYSAQFGEVGRFSNDEWASIVQPSDLRVLNQIREHKDKYIFLHLCGEPDYDFKVHIDRYKDYPKDIINWAIYANNYELERGRDFFQCPILGGMNNRDIMINGTKEEIFTSVSTVIESFGKAGFILGADCSIQGAVDRQKIKYAVNATREASKH